MFILLLIVTALHLSITLVISIKIYSWKSINANKKPLISIIIAARNESENLKQLIPALLSQKYPDFEILIGLDRCNDQSVEILENMLSKKIYWADIQQIPDDWNSKKYVLKEVIKNAKGEWLVFTDADCIPNSQLWLEALSKEMDDKDDIVLGVSPYFKNGKLLAEFIRFEAFMTYFLYIGMTLFHRPYMAVGRNLAVKKTYFDYLEGYYSIKNVRGGDDDLLIQKAKKANIRVAIGKESLIYSYPSENWNIYKKQKLRHYSVSNHYQKSDQIILSLYHILHFGFYVTLPFTVYSNFFSLIILFYLFIRLVSYRFVESKVGAGFNHILFPFVDLLYALIVPVLGVWSKLVKDIIWKN
ncbi:MAG: glycosyltransferase [Bacteroidota bacterium]